MEDGQDDGYSCATDDTGNIFLAGNTTSTSGIATSGAHQTTLEATAMPF